MNRTTALLVLVAMNRSLRSALLLMLLALGLPGAANTVFEISPDTVYVGRDTDTVEVYNLSRDTILLDTVYMSFDTNACEDCFQITVVFLTGRDSLPHGYTATSHGPEELNVLSGHPENRYIPDGGTQAMHTFSLISWGVDPMGTPPPLPDTLDVILVFVVGGERDTLIVRREVSSGTGHQGRRDAESMRSGRVTTGWGDDGSFLGTLLNGRQLLQLHAWHKTGAHTVLRYREERAHRVIVGSTGGKCNE